MTARFLAGLMATALVLTVANPAQAALAVGAQAPDFTLQGALGGTPLTFTLSKALKDGPVVLYFFPAAFTKGCTIEAHEFAEATDKFKAMHATVIGVTAGNVDRVAEFSKVECRNKFAVAADPGAAVAKQYDATMLKGVVPLSNRTSYVIAPGGKIIMSYTDMSPDAHIQKAMDAVAGYEKGGK